MPSPAAPDSGTCPQWRGCPPLRCASAESFLLNRPVVECRRIEVSSVGPDKGVNLSVDFHLFEQGSILQGAGHLANQHGAKVNPLLRAVCEFHCKRVLSDDSNSGDAMNCVTHESKALIEIELPEITEAGSDTDGSFGVTGGSAEVVYDRLGGFSRADVTASDFDGQFVGTETGQNAGRAVIGTWKVGDLLEGSFGAERVGTSPATLPSLTSAQRYLLKSSLLQDGGTSINNADPTSPMLVLGDTAYTDEFTLSSLGNVTNRAQTNLSTLRATIRLRSTAFARFGAWKTVDSSQDPATIDDGLFTYSPLADTGFSTNPNYRPRRVSAEYAGRTVAIDPNGKLYDGSYLLMVDWAASGNSNSTAVISGLSGYTIDGVGVSRIGLSHTFDSGDDFSGTAAPRVRYTTGSDQTLTGGTYSHQGQFVGNLGPDGPYGVFGTWEINQSGEGDDIKGAFGADLVREP